MTPEKPSRVIVGFELKPGRDQALIDWLNKTPVRARSTVIRNLLSQALILGEPTQNKPSAPPKPVAPKTTQVAPPPVQPENRPANPNVAIEAMLALDQEF